MLKTYKKGFAFLLLFSMIVGLVFPVVSAADGGTVTTVETIPQSKLMKPGSQQQLTAVVKDEYGEFVDNQPLGWNSSDLDIAGVNENGLVTAVYEGTTTVTAACYGILGNCLVTVENPKLDKLELNLNASVIALGSGIELNAVLYDQFGDEMNGLDISWSSSDSVVAKVYENGQVIGLAEGTATITANCNGFEDTCEITVQKPTPQQITLNSAAVNLIISTSKALQAVVKDQFDQVMAGQSINWSIENPDIAQVDANGTITSGQIAGNTTVTAACYGFADIKTSCPVRVFEDETNIVVITGTTGFIAPIVEAYHNLTERRNPPYHFGLKVFLPDDLESDEKNIQVRDAVLNADVVLLEMVGANRDTKLNEIFSYCYEHKWQADGQPEIFVQRSSEKDGDGIWSTTGFIVNILKDLPVTINKDYDEWTKINTYILNSGVSNWERLFLYLGEKYGKGDIVAGQNLDPVLFPQGFVYHPAADISSPIYEGVVIGDGSGIFTSPEDYYTWYAGRNSYNPDAPWVGMIGYDSFCKNADQDLYIETLKSLEEKGLNVILLYPTSTNRKNMVKEYFHRDLDNDGEKEPAIDTFICAIGFMFDSKNEAGTQELFKEMNVPVLNPIYSSDLEDWEDNPAGAYDTVYWQVAQPELEGRIEPVIMGGTVTLSVDEETGAQVSKKVVLPDRIERLAGRAYAWAKLHRMKNEDKKVAILYYNMDGGKDGITASYLNVPRSLTEILKATKDAGYHVDPHGEFEDSQGTITEEKVFEAMFNKGRNIGGWAPGELDSLTNQEGIIRISQEEYLDWFNLLPESLRENVEEEWGPAPGEVMVNDGEIIIPGVMTGNIFFGPQPMRGWGEDVSKINHSPTLPPTHQYLAFYLWLQHGYQADVVVHLGTHGTAEWLPGKSVGLSGKCWPDVVQGNMPNIYPYIVNNPGEATQAKRRGYSVTIDHLTAALANTELYGALLELHDLTHQYEFAIDPVNNQPPEEAVKLQAKIIQLVESDGLDKKIGMDLEQTPFMELLNAAHEYLHDMEADVTPLGLHTFGVAPEGQAFEDMVAAIINYDPESRIAIEDEIRESLTKTTEEIDMLLLALDAGFISPGLGTDPVRNPDVMPTGKNIKSFDPRTVPEKKVAWPIGKDCADELLETYYAEEGKYPESIISILWAVETMRTEGQSIAMIMRLMGIEPAWSSKGYVQSYKIISIEELGRPRIDVVMTMSGLFRDTFSTATELLDQAARELALLDESPEDNYIKKHYDALKEELINQGKSEDEAKFLAGSRVFGPAPGSYGVGLSEKMDAAESWDTTEELVEVYLSRMGYIYGKNMDGTTVFGQKEKDLLVSNLKYVDAAIMVRDSTYGATDNDDVAQYLGGAVMAAEWASGHDVMAYIANTRLGKGKSKIQTFAQFVSQELDSRLFNPKFVEAMMKEGYAGSATIAKYIGNVFFLDATTGVISDQVWHKLAATYIFNDTVRSQIDPYALQSIIGYSFIAAQKGMWQADQEDLSKLSDTFIKSICEYGVVCCHHTCKNIVMHEWQAQFATLDKNQMNDYQNIIAQATGEDVDIPRRETSSNKRDNKKDDKLEIVEETPVVTQPIEVPETTPEPEQPVTKPEEIPEPEPEMEQEEPVVQVVAESKIGMEISDELKQLAQGDTEEKDDESSDSASIGAGPEPPVETPQETETRAYELEKKESTPMSTGTKAVSAVAILGALGFVGFFFKGYLTKRI